MRFVQDKTGLLVPDRRLRAPRAPQRQRGFLGSGIGFWKKLATGGGGDPLWSDVYSLLPMSGANGSTTFTDQIGARAWTRHGSVQITTAVSPFAGGSSGAFASGYLETGAINDWTFLHNNSTPWTVDVWVRFSAIGATQGIFGTNKGSSANVGVGCWVDPSGFLRFFQTSPSPCINWTSSSAVFTAGVFRLVSLQWDTTLGSYGGVSIFVDGTMLASVNSGALASTASPSYWLDIGALGSSALPITGDMAQWRVTKALRYSGNFTPPSGPWPTHA